MLKQTENGYEWEPANSEEKKRMSVASLAEIMQACFLNSDKRKKWGMGQLDIDGSHFATLARRMWQGIGEEIRRRQPATESNGTSANWWELAASIFDELLDTEELRVFFLEHEPYVEPVPAQAKAAICEHFIEHYLQGAKYEPIAVCRASNCPYEDGNAYLVYGKLLANPEALCDGISADAYRRLNSEQYATWIWDQDKRKTNFGRYDLSEDECLALMESRFSDIDHALPGMESKDDRGYKATLCDINLIYRETKDEHVCIATVPEAVRQAACDAIVGDPELENYTPWAMCRKSNKPSKPDEGQFIIIGRDDHDIWSFRLFDASTGKVSRSGPSAADYAEAEQVLEESFRDVTGIAKADSPQSAFGWRASATFVSKEHLRAMSRAHEELLKPKPTTKSIQEIARMSEWERGEFLNECPAGSTITGIKDKHGKELRATKRDASEGIAWGGKMLQSYWDVGGHMENMETVIQGATYSANRESHGARQEGGQAADESRQHRRGR